MRTTPTGKHPASLSTEHDQSISDVIRSAIRVPGWFPVSAALRIARLKQVEYLLVLDRQSPVGSVSVRTLEAAPGYELVARWMRRCDTTVSPETSRDEVYRLMSVHGVECLAVASGAILVGLVAREDLLLPGGWGLAAE